MSTIKKVGRVEAPNHQHITRIYKTWKVGNKQIQTQINLLKVENIKKNFKKDSCFLDCNITYFTEQKFSVFYFY